MSNATIGMGEEHGDLQDAVRAFARRHVTESAVRGAVDAETEKLPAFWSTLAQQGLLGLHLPEGCGGSGYGLLETAVVLEELGRNLTPGPFLPVVLASAVLHRAGHHTHLSELAEGTTLAAVGLTAGTLTATSTSGGTMTISGESAPVLGGHLAEVLILPVTGDATLGETTTWVVLHRQDVHVENLASHDPTRRLGSVRVTEVTIPAEQVLSGLDQRTPHDLAATLFAAEASGLADWATHTAADHARTREQFNRTIGQFQGVKHRCARMLCRTEQARVCAWDAARANDPTSTEAPTEAELAAAVAGATSPEAAVATTKDCIQTLGGIGYTWEHNAHLYLRRAQTLRLLLGTTTSWQHHVAELALAGTRRHLDVELPPQAEEIRTRIRVELQPATTLDETDRRTYLADHGYTAPHLPEPWGKSADALTQMVISEELQTAGLAPVDMIIGNWVVPTLITHGSEEQRQRFLPPSLRGDVTWCQLFSEPGAGSDLAGLATRAHKVPGGWKVNGQKVWTSMAREAHYGILLARTDPNAPKHKGLSYFLLDMATPGIDIRPLRELTGQALFNEIFFDDVFIPDDMMVAEPGDGWKLARTTLAHERVSLSNDSALGSGGETLVELVSSHPQQDGEQRRTTLGQILCDAQSGGLFGLRNVLRSVAGQQPGAEASVAKLIGVEHIQEVWETAMDWTGAQALVGTPDPNGPVHMFLNSRSMSIAGGTTDVQLNIIGERLLGLPRDT